MAEMNPETGAATSPARHDAAEGRSARGRFGRSAQILGFTLLWLTSLFGGAGTLEWTRGWVYFALVCASMVVTGVAIKRNPGLMEARLKWRRKDTKRFDRFILATYLPLSYVQLFVAGLDVVWFRRPALPVAGAFAGVVLFVLATALIAWTLAVNRFAETSVRIQTDRGHTVISTGPYAFVRHPMYAGAIMLHVATGLILGSRWALGVGGLMILVLIVRTALEDAALRRELAGYAEYAATRTRYRLIPGAW